MALPALGPVVDSARDTARRFPAVLIAAVASAVAAICILEDIGPGWMQARLLAAASLGLALLTAATLAAEREPSPARKAVWFAGAVVVLAGVFAVWPGLTEQQRFFRYAQLSLAGHLAVAFWPVPAGRHNAFWQFNRTLFIRFVVAAITTGVTWLGLALALLALDKLFGVPVPDEGYGRLWFALAFVLNTMLFLGGVPRDIEALESRRDYPVGLRVFAQYTLLPLVSLYLVILTLYLAKVLVTWDWPSGWIGWLVSGVATAGIFTLLLVHPAAAEQKWVGVFARDFWIAILPAIGMLWLAIKQRTDQYGMTEPRYFLLLLSLWLFGLSLFYIFTRSPRIRVIPASLCAVALVTFAGPLSAYAAAERSQAGRLRALLAKREAGLDSTDRREVAATVRFLVERNATRRIAAEIGDSLVRHYDAFGREAAVRRIVKALGVEYAAGTRADRFYLTSGRVDSVAIGGFEVLVRIRPGDDTATTAALAARLRPDGRAIRLTRGDSVVIDVPLDSLLSRARPLSRMRALAGELMQVRAENGNARALVLLESLSGTAGRADRADGLVAVSVKRRR